MAVSAVLRPSWVIARPKTRRPAVAAYGNWETAAAPTAAPALQACDSWDFDQSGDGEAAACCWHGLGHEDPPQPLQPGSRFAAPAVRATSNAPPHSGSLASVMSQLDLSLDGPEEGLSDWEECVMQRGYEAAACWQADLPADMPSLERAMAEPSAAVCVLGAEPSANGRAPQWEVPDSEDEQPAPSWPLRIDGSVLASMDGMVGIWVDSLASASLPSSGDDAWGCEPAESAARDDFRSLLGDLMQLEAVASRCGSGSVDAPTAFAAAGVV